MSTDPAAGIGVLTALAAGIVSFLSPCVLPLVPGYLSAVTGVAAADLEKADWRRVIVPSLLFVSSFSVIFILLGLGATGIGSALQQHQLMLDKIAAGLIIAMGVFFIPQLNREWHVETLLERAGTGGPLIAGAAFGLAWTPCIGPTLAAILGAAAVSGSAAHGAFLLAVYSAGLAIPFLLTSVAFTRMTTAFAVVKRHYPVIMAIGGVILIAFGVAILTGWFDTFNRWAQDGLDGLGINFSANV